MSRVIIGLAGKAGSGKTTAAQHLEDRGYTRLSFAAPIKQIATRYFGLNDQDVYKDKTVEARTILQGIGGLIRHIDPDYILAQMQDDICGRQDDERIVIDDIRLHEEAELIKALGGTVIKLSCSNPIKELTQQQQTDITENGVDLIEPNIHIMLHYGQTEQLRKTMELIADHEEREREKRQCLPGS